MSDLLGRLSGRLDIYMVDACRPTRGYADMFRYAVAKGMVWWWQRAMANTRKRCDWNIMGSAGASEFFVIAGCLNEWLCVMEAHQASWEASDDG